MAVSRRSARAILSSILVLAVAASLLRADDEPKKLPDGVTAITPKQLDDKVPHFFCFDYPFEPLPGRRIWMRINDEFFIERYPDRSDGLFKIIGHAKARGMEGTIVAKAAGDLAKTGTPNDESFQVFIPDKNGEELAILFRPDARTEWQDMSWSQNRKTIIVKVE